MKILFISLMEGFSWGGSEELWYNVASTAIDKNHEVELFIKNWEGNTSIKIHDIKKRGAKVNFRLESKHEGLKKKLFKYYLNKFFKIDLSVTLKNQKLIKEINPDIVLVNFGGAYDIKDYEWLSDYLINNNKKYFIIQQFNFEYSSLPYSNVNLVKQFFGKAQRSYFVSKRNLETTERNLVIHLDNAKLISNPFKLKNIKTLSYPANSEINFACVARIQCNIKCQDMLLEAFSNQEWKERNWHLNFYGNGPDLSFIKDLTKFYNLEHNVTFHNHVEDITDIWNSNHILVLPSIAEGTPLTLIEAMFLGRTAIVSDVGGNTSLIDDQVNGFIIKGQSTKALSEALNTAWARKDEWEKMGLEAMKKVKENINLNSSAEIFNDLINANNH